MTQTSLRTPGSGRSGPPHLVPAPAYAPPHATRDQLRLPGLGHRPRARPCSRRRRPSGSATTRCWTAEAYGTDAVTPLHLAHGEHRDACSFGSAILQMPARTPAMTAMTAATLDLMSGGRFLLGLGSPARRSSRAGTASRTASRSARRVSTSTSCVRSCAREAPLEHHGAHYDIPYQRPRRDGPRQAAQDHRAPAPRRHPDLPRGDRAEERPAVRRDRRRVAPDLLLARPRFRETYGAAIDAGFAKAGGGKSLADFDVAPTVTVIVGDDLETLRGFVKPMAALYIGGMGARGKNFYNDLACRYGFEAAAEEDPGPVPRRQEARRDRGGARRAGRRDRADRAEGAHRGPARGVEGERDHHAHRRRQQPEALQRHGRARPLSGAPGSSTNLIPVRPCGG